MRPLRGAILTPLLVVLVALSGCATLGGVPNLGSYENAARFYAEANGSTPLLASDPNAGSSSQY
ncbi:MAG: hypothetical protein HYT80_00705, partial [Euryarchaeota archaeon]|nr:hypothetical protein [Euryarchaeota archaeon]